MRTVQVNWLPYRRCGKLRGYTHIVRWWRHCWTAHARWHGLVSPTQETVVTSILFVYATRRNANNRYVPTGTIGTNWLMINVPAEVMPASVFAALHGRAPGQSSTSGTECHTVLVGSRVQLQETVSAGTGSRGVSCISSLCWTITLAVWWSDSKKTELY